MLFTCLALLLFLQDKIRLAALACAALVLVKETGLLVPLLFGVWLLYEKRRATPPGSCCPPPCSAPG
jgi:predicted membrane-bound dolichyl-phosphate-mannose-protein mannosyltransferase